MPKKKKTKLFPYSPYIVRKKNEPKESFDDFKFRVEMMPFFLLLQEYRLESQEYGRLTAKDENLWNDPVKNCWERLEFIRKQLDDRYHSLHKQVESSTYEADLAWESLYKERKKNDVKVSKSLISKIDNPDATLVSDGIDGADVSGFIDTGSYALNALLSGSIFGGLPNNKISCLAGDPATGKTFYAIGIAGQFLKDHKDGVVIYFDTEQAVTSDMFTARGVDPERVAVIPVATIEEFKTQALKIVNDILEQPEDERKPVFMILDSLGMLSTRKEMTDSAEGKDVRDMTKAQQTKATFRVLTLKLGKAKIPMLLTNHTYQVIGAYVPTKELGGGIGLKYAASNILTLSKSKDKTDEGVVGNFIKCTNYKNRFVKENMNVETRLNYTSGLSRYYGLTDLALKYGIFKKVSTRIELPDGNKVFEKNIDEEPEKYFTKDILDKLDVEIQKDFKYGQSA